MGFLGGAVFAGNRALGGQYRFRAHITQCPYAWLLNPRAVTSDRLQVTAAAILVRAGKNGFDLPKRASKSLLQKQT